MCTFGLKTLVTFILRDILYYLCLRVAAACSSENSLIFPIDRKSFGIFLSWVCFIHGKSKTNIHNYHVRESFELKWDARCCSFLKTREGIHHLPKLSIAGSRRFLLISSIARYNIFCCAARISSSVLSLNSSNETAVSGIHESLPTLTNSARV